MAALESCFLAVLRELSLWQCSQSSGIACTPRVQVSYCSIPAASTLCNAVVSACICALLQLT